MKLESCEPQHSYQIPGAHFDIDRKTPSSIQNAHVKVWRVWDPLWHLPITSTWTLQIQPQKMLKYQDYRVKHHFEGYIQIADHFWFCGERRCPILFVNQWRFLPGQRGPFSAIYRDTTPLAHSHRNHIHV